MATILHIQQVRFGEDHVVRPEFLWYNGQVYLPRMFTYMIRFTNQLGVLDDFY